MHDRSVVKFWWKEMKKKDYSIDYKGLSVGCHEFDFVIDGLFFQEKEADRIVDAQLNAKVVVEKSGRQMEVSLLIDGTLNVECDRCLDVFEMPLHIEQPFVVKSAGQSCEDDQDVLWLSPEDDSLDLTDYIYDTVCLSLPFQVVHPNPEDCNQDVIACFKSVTVEEFDEMFPEESDDANAEVGLNEENMAKLAALKQSVQDNEKK